MPRPKRGARLGSNPAHQRLLLSTLASQLSDFTGGEDGLTFKIPEALRPSTDYGEFLGASIDGRLLTYYLIFIAALVLVLALLRIVNSPFGRVLQAIRENDFRAEAIGYRTVVYRTVSTVLSAMFATLCAFAALQACVTRARRARRFQLWRVARVTRLAQGNGRIFIWVLS